MKRPRLPKPEKGNTMVEFALCFFLLFAILSGIFRFGYVFYAYNLLVNAVRDGARFGSTYPYSSTTAIPDDTYRTKVQNMVVYGTPNPSGNAVPVVAGLSRRNVAVTMTAGNAGTIQPPTDITVSIVNFNLDAVFGNVLLNNRPYSMFPYTGILTPPSN
jgi:Flp pilus assembly protein TadG